MLILKTQEALAPAIHTLIVPVWLYHKNNPEQELVVYAILDDQSDPCFIKDDILHKLDVIGPDVQLQLSMVLGENLVTCQKVNDLVVRGLNDYQEVLLP